MAEFLPGERGGMPDTFLDQNPLRRFLSILSSPEEDLDKFRTPPINPNAEPTLTGGTRSAADFGKSTQQPKAGGSKLDKLMMFLVPAASGFIASQFGRRRDRMRNFLAGATQGGLGVLQDVTTRGARQKAAQQAALEAAIKEKRTAEKHKLDIEKGTLEVESLRNPKAKAPKYELRERRNADGSTVLERVNVDTGEATPVTTEEATRIGSTPTSGPLFGTQQEQRGTVTRRVPFGSAAPPKKEEVSKPVSRYDRRSGKSVFVENNPAMPNFGEVIKETKTGTPEPRQTSARDERKAERSKVQEFADRAIARAKRLNKNYDSMEFEEKINAIKDAAEVMAGATPETQKEMRPLLRDVFAEVDAIVRRRRPPKRGSSYPDPRQATNVK